jgi:integrase/recombinase XerD
MFMVQPEVLMPSDGASSSKNKVAVFIEGDPQYFSDLTRKDVPKVPEVLGSDCESIDDLIFEFLRDLSPTTARSYKRDLEHFFAFTSRNFDVPKLVDNKIDFNEVKRVHVVKYKAALETEPNSRGEKYAPNSIGRKISSAASFFQFLRQRELIDKNPCEFVKRPPNLLVRPTEALDEDEIKRLFKLIIRRANPLHRSVLLLMWTSGLRNHEIRKIKLKDFEMRDGVKVLRYVGKGKKENVVPIHPATAYHLGLYLEWMDKKGRPIQPDDFLFQASKRASGGGPAKPLSHTSLGYIVKKWCRQINMGKRITPHSARASYISCLLANGVDLYDVAKAVAHSSTNTTSRYDKRKRNFRQSPLFKLDLF